MGFPKCFSPTISLADQLGEKFSCYYPESEKILLKPESCIKYRSEAQKALFLKRSWSDFDPKAYTLYGEDQNHETSFKGNALQGVVDSWCKIQVKQCCHFKYGKEVKRHISNGLGLKQIFV